MLKYKTFGIFCLISIAIGISSIILAIQFYPNYSWTENSISDLGVSHPSAIIFNTGFIIAGVFLALYSLGEIYYSEDIIERILYSILMIAGFLFSSIGFIPENIVPLHGYLAILLYFDLGIFFIFAAIYYINKKALRMGFLALIAFLFGLFVWLIPWKEIGVTGVAIPEVLSVLIGIIWLLIKAFDVIQS